MSGITIERAAPDNAAAMHELQQIAFKEEGRRSGTVEIPPLQETAESIAEHIRSQIALLAREDGVIVGCIRGVVDGGVCTVRALAVHPSMHGKGIGSRLVKALESGLEDATRIVLTTNTAMERNVPFYERHGYKVLEYTTPIPGIRLAQMAKG